MWALGLEYLWSCFYLKTGVSRNGLSLGDSERDTSSVWMLITRLIINPDAPVTSTWLLRVFNWLWFVGYSTGKWYPEKKPWAATSQWLNGCNNLATTYRKVASSILVYYSIFDHFWGATNWDVLLTETCYYYHLQQSMKRPTIIKRLHELISIFVYPYIAKIKGFEKNKNTLSKDFNPLIKLIGEI